MSTTWRAVFFSFSFGLRAKQEHSQLLIEISLDFDVPLIDFVIISRMLFDSITHKILHNNLAAQPFRSMSYRR